MMKQIEFDHETKLHMSSKDLKMSRCALNIISTESISCLCNICT